MRGSLHCATHGETVSGFGRDDAFCGWGKVGRRSNGNCNCNGNSNGDSNNNCNDTNKGEGDRL